MLQKIAVINKCCSFELSIHQGILKQKNVTWFPKKYYATQLSSKLIMIINEKQVSILEWFLKDHVTLKTGVMMQKIQLRNKLINSILKYIRI